MKNQYFADTRDLFKYDLVIELVSSNSLINRFTYIPMLTEDESSYKGGKIDYSKARAGTSRIELRNFLEKCLRENKRSIDQLELFFRGPLTRNVTLTIYKKDEHFSHHKREEYFVDIEARLLAKAVILVDPDVGLEVKSMREKEDKYVKYEEVKLLYDRMDRYSILLIFQFIPRMKRQRYFVQISKRLKQKVLSESPVHYITDNQIVFFILTKDKSQKFLENALSTYANCYELMLGKE